jgi:hypothetical protein
VNQKAKIKSQIPSTKLQINLKFQYPMTKTITALAPFRIAKLSVLGIMPLGTNAADH